MGGRAPFHMFDARCELGEVSIKCSDVGLGEVCLALVIDGVDCMCTARLFGVTSMSMRYAIDVREYSIHNPI